MRRYFAGAVTIIIVIAVLVGLSAAGAIEFDRPIENEFAPNRSTYNSGQTGTRAVYQLLEESGVETFWSLRVCFYLNYTMKDYKVADKYAKKWITKYPEFGWCYQLYALMLIEENKLDEAINILEQGLKAKVNHDYMKLQMYQLLIKSYEIKNNPKKVKETAQKALELYEGYWIPKHLEKKIIELRNYTE